MRRQAFAIIFCFVLSAYCHNISAQIERGDEDVIAAILKSRSKGDVFTVLNQNTAIGMTDLDDPKEIESSKTYIKKNLKIPGYDHSKLVDALFFHNQKKIRLSLSSLPTSGYVVDYDGKYESYFKKDGGGWERLRKEIPNARGNTTVSIPVIDRKLNIILIYIGGQHDWEAGAGHVIAFKYENGKFQELSSVMLWIS